VVEVLLLEGANAQYVTQAEGKTALIHAAYNGAAACVNVLLDKIFDK
jgi:ankyrin repeat protein